MAASVADYREFLVKSGVRGIPDDEYLEEVLAGHKSLDGRDFAMLTASLADAREAVRTEDALGKVRLDKLERMVKDHAAQAEVFKERLADLQKTQTILLTLLEHLREIASTISSQRK